MKDLATFQRFLGLAAGWVGQLLNYSSLANDAGITVNTVKSWLGLLEAARQLPIHGGDTQGLREGVQLVPWNTIAEVASRI